MSRFYSTPLLFPAKPGTQAFFRMRRAKQEPWVPAFAGNEG
jgi:hypothetical protein